MGDRTRVDRTGVFGVPGGNDNGRRVVELYAERNLYVGNIYIKHRSLFKYTRVARGQDRVEVKSMIVLVQVKKLLLQDVRAVRGMGRDLSDHHVVLCKIRLVEAWLVLGALEARN